MVLYLVDRFESLENIRPGAKPRAKNAVLIKLSSLKIRKEDDDKIKIIK